MNAKELAAYDLYVSAAIGSPLVAAQAGIVDVRPDQVAVYVAGYADAIARACMVKRRRFGAGAVTKRKGRQ